MLAPTPVIRNIKSTLHTCNAQHQPSVRPANIAYLQGEENQPHTSRTESSTNTSVFASIRQRIRPPVRLLVKKKTAGPWRLAVNLRRVEAARKTEARGSLKACAGLVSCWCCCRRRSSLVLEVLRCINARTHGVDHLRKARTTSAPLRMNCSTVSLVQRTSSAQVTDWERLGPADGGKNLHSKCNDLITFLYFASDPVYTCFEQSRSFSKVWTWQHDKLLVNFGEAPSSFSLGQSQSLDAQSQVLRLRPGYSHTV